MLQSLQPDLLSPRTADDLRDRILLKGLRFYGHIGFAPEERILGQWFEVDFELWANLRPSALSGQLCDTLDYRSAVAAIAEMFRTEHYELIETLAEAIAEIVLRETKAVQARIRLTKCHPPIAEITGQVVLDIIRP